MSLLPRSFYARDTVTVAKDLLGKKLVRKIGNRTISGIITETEAYRHKDDPASHAFRRKTDRNRAMFEEVGRSYVYFTYGMYFCFNVVARKPSVEAGAVLIRGIHPEKGIEIMKKNRGKDNEKILANGPAKLTQALKITRKHYGLDLTKNSELFIKSGPYRRKKITSTPRVGIREATDKLWNFKIKVEQ
ncbi:MAG: DNA-3-methyladenine glycosylase [Nitrososphaeria archaeon]|nr:DNA-3-methyladenine glycosylase [Nitrosopumilaceae archaeon]NIP10143.1 DNA-3-methyladenine glycosylase [Nitrosopumilaceae archaeon]NIP91507.1 DNA-3-methyladenine glycosylase [Nitrososphaeria archaeon]NIS95342.1 DNA-3-methyladenine glycosylase [Nitrosopumilaceae archaeon]